MITAMWLYGLQSKSKIYRFSEGYTNNVRIAEMLRFLFGSNAHEAIKTIYYL
jgi:hypothetical protein